MSNNNNKATNDGRKEMLLTYQYGKAGEAKEQRAPTTKAPIIQFNVQPQQRTEERIIDISDEDE